MIGSIVNIVKVAKATLILLVKYGLIANIVKALVGTVYFLVGFVAALVLILMVAQTWLLNLIAQIAKEQELKMLNAIGRLAKHNDVERLNKVRAAICSVNVAAPAEEKARAAIAVMLEEIVNAKAEGEAWRNNWRAITKELIELKDAYKEITKRNARLTSERNDLRLSVTRLHKQLRQAKTLSAICS